MSNLDHERLIQEEEYRSTVKRINENEQLDRRLRGYAAKPKTEEEKKIDALIWAGVGIMVLYQLVQMGIF